MNKIIEINFYKETKGYLNSLYIELKVNNLIIGQMESRYTNSNGHNFVLFENLHPNLEYITDTEKIEQYEVLFNKYYVKRLEILVYQINKEIKQEEKSNDSLLKLNLKKLFLIEIKKLLNGEE